MYALKVILIASTVFALSESNSSTTLPSSTTSKTIISGGTVSKANTTNINSNNSSSFGSANNFSTTTRPSFKLSSTVSPTTTRKTSGAGSDAREGSATSFSGQGSSLGTAQSIPRELVSSLQGQGVHGEDMEGLMVQVTDLIKECSNGTDMGNYATKFADIANSFLKVIESRRR